jgi:hypothetical protein
MRYVAMLGFVLLLGACGDDADKATDSDVVTTTPTDVEICGDGIGNDGDGLLDCDDSECETTCDADADGYIDLSQGGDDCDDSNPAVNPLAPEICDGIDNNCDGLVDDEDPLVDASASPWYADQDGDGFGNPDQVLYSCGAPGGPTSQDNTDCNDQAAAVNPLAIEVCDGVDNNCDGLTDEDDPALDLSTQRTFYLDSDGDGFGDPTLPTDACTQPIGYVEGDQDCDDSDFDVNPAAPEICDAVDNDCDGILDNLIDQDSDGFIACGLAPDCDDLDGNSYPGAPELCDGLDNDCDTVVPADESDADGDGVRVCGGDCDDAEPAMNPTLPEVCDGLDNDCDTHIDNLIDADGDGFIVCGLTPDCDDLDPYTHPGAYEMCDGIDNDCDTIIPADEDDIDGDGLRICDGDCDDLDPILGLPGEWFFDNDGDGHGVPPAEPSSCVSPGVDYVPYLDDDCDDNDPLVFPGAPDICGDYFDADCDGDDCGCGGFMQDPAYNADITFTDSLPGTTMTLTYDALNYWSTSGGGPGGDRLGEYDAFGLFIVNHQPNVDWRAVFTKEDSVGPVYGRGFNSSQIQVMTAPGVFANDVLLNGGAMDSQSSVAFDSERREFIALNSNGDVQRWDEAGNFVGTVTLQGYGAMGTEGQYPQNRGVAWMCDYYLTYADGNLSAWDSTTGTRTTTSVLTGAGVSFDSHFSLSFANERAFVVDVAGGTWRGYPLLP